MCVMNQSAVYQCRETNGDELCEMRSCAERRGTITKVSEPSLQRVQQSFSLKIHVGQSYPMYFVLQNFLTELRTMFDTWMLNRAEIITLYKETICHLSCYIKLAFSFFQSIHFNLDTFFFFFFLAGITLLLWSLKKKVTHITVASHSCSWSGQVPPNHAELSSHDSLSQPAKPGYRPLEILDIEKIVMPYPYIRF